MTEFLLSLDAFEIAIVLIAIYYILLLLSGLIVSILEQLNIAKHGWPIDYEQTNSTGIEEYTDDDIF